MKAAVFHGPHQALTIEEVDIDKPMGREVLVRTVASGVCHSDLHFVDGFYPFPTPAILGHEAAGIVEEVGLQVGEFKPGDHVIACLSVFCGHCDYCLTGKTHLCQTRPVRAKTDPPKPSWTRPASRPAAPWPSSARVAWAWPPSRAPASRGRARSSRSTRWSPSWPRRASWAPPTASTRRPAIP